MKSEFNGIRYIRPDPLLLIFFLSLSPPPLEILILSDPGKLLRPFDPQNGRWRTETERERERERSDFLAFQLQIKHSEDGEAAREPRSIARSLCAPPRPPSEGDEFLKSSRRNQRSYLKVLGTSSRKVFKGW